MNGIPPINYTYTHRQTESTTGYFSCEPYPAPGETDLVRLMCARPLDSFLRRYALERFAHLAGEELPRMFMPYVKTADYAQKVTLSGFIQELAELSPTLNGQAEELLEKIRQTGMTQLTDLDVAYGTPLLYLRRKFLPDAKLHAAWSQIFAENIRGHRKLPAVAESGLPPLFPQRSEIPLPSVSLRNRLNKAGNTPKNTATLMPVEEVAELALERLREAGAVAGAEQRHMASLSPIGLLMPWKLDIKVDDAENRHTLKGTANTYGRGLSLPQARASCRMEMVERFSAYISIKDGYISDRVAPARLYRARRSEILAKGHAAIDPEAFYIETPYSDQPLMWVQGQRVERHTMEIPACFTPIWVPLQMVILFSNCAEIDLCGAAGSTGIAAGSLMEQAKLAALTEIMERDAEATTVYRKERCFFVNPANVPDEKLRLLLEDYRYQGINVQFMDMTGFLGLPCYQAFVTGPRGSIHRGHGASLSGQRALLSALTETPFSYPGGGASGPMPRNIPERALADLPDYSLGNVASDLALLEYLLCANGLNPVYVDLTHEKLRFPVVRALVPGMAPSADFDEFTRISPRLYEDYLCNT